MVRMTISSPTRRSPWRRRLPFVVMAMLAMLLGLLSGLQRIGWSLPMTSVAPHHGAIMVGGFLGTLITLEKVIPLKRKILFLFPVISASSVASLAFGNGLLPSLLLIIASLGLTVVFLLYWLQERSIIYTLMFLGAACWLMGNIQLAVTGFYPNAVPWWTAFILFIIVSERLELSKFLPVTGRHKTILLALLMLYLVGCALTFHGVGRYMASFSLLGIGLWLMRHDVVSINLRKRELPRYVGIALLAGYFSLLLGGMFLLFANGQPLSYDIYVHSLFIGFAFSMIFAHGPVILPGVLGISSKPYHPLLYFWLLLLHSSWLARVATDIALSIQLRMYTGLASAMAILGYFITLAFITLRTSRAKLI